MEVIEINTADKRQVQKFLDLPYRIYQDTPQWVPPLKADARQPLDRKKFPYYRSNDAAFLLVVENGQVIGRVAILENRRFNAFNDRKAATFYLFECENTLEAATSMFEHGAEWARKRGLEELIGPKGFTVFDGLGLLVEGFEYRPAFGQPYHQPYYRELVESCGFQVTGELVTGTMEESTKFPEKVHQVADILKRRRGLSVAHCETRGELRKVLEQLKELYNQSLGETRENTPVTDEEFQALSRQMLWFADPKLIKIVMKGDEPVGFLLAYPDVSAALQKTRGSLLPFGWLVMLVELRRTKWININGAGIVERYRGLGGTALLFSEMYKSVAESRYRFADIVQIGTENEKMLREIRDFGIKINKFHRMYRLAL